MAESRFKPHPDALKRAVSRQAARLYPEDPVQQGIFIDAVVSASAARPSLIKLTDQKLPFETEALTSWQPEWLTSFSGFSKEAGQHSFHAAGAYYLMDFSSIFEASVILNLPSGGTILDLCAAPGGKGIFAYRALAPELLISNEIIGKRQGMLVSNLQRCHIERSAVTRLDPGQISAAAPESFDLVLVDAPCSGQSIIARGSTAAGAFQTNVVAANMTRQRRILANATASVKPGGSLAYTTCTYSREENEKNVEWLMRRFPELEAVEVPHLKQHRSWLAEFPCYRLMPQDGLGAGGFTCLLHKKGVSTSFSVPSPLERLRPVWEYKKTAEHIA